MRSLSWPLRFGCGLTDGMAIAGVDNCAFEGEVSPIVIVIVLFVTTITTAGTWGRNGWIASGAAWV